MITGAHTILYSSNPEADRNFFKNVLKFNHVDIGQGWLIFALPPSEMAVHPSTENGLVECYLLCDDIVSFIKEMSEEHIDCQPQDSQRWGVFINGNMNYRNNGYSS
jgi:hypothetical protein